MSLKAKTQTKKAQSKAIAIALLAISFVVSSPSFSQSTRNSKKREPAQSLKKTQTPLPGLPSAGGSSAGVSIKLKPAKGAKPAAATKTAVAAKKPAPAPAAARPVVAKPAAPVRSSAPGIAKASNDSGPSRSVLNLRSSWAADGPRLSETSALGLDGVYVVVPASFVSETWTVSGDSRFFVEDSIEPLDLIVFDLTSDIAVFYSRVQVPTSISRNRVRGESPSSTEDLVALANSGPSVELKRRGSWTEGALYGDLYDLNTSTATSRFVFDRGGRWISLIGSRKARGIVNGLHGAPSSRVLELLSAWEQNPQRSVVDRQSFSAQLSSWQNLWANWFFETSRRGPSLRWLDCHASPAPIREPALAGDIESTRSVQCTNVAPLPIGSGYSAGVEVIRGDLVLRRDVKQLLANDSTSGTVFADSLFAKQSSDTGLVNILTPPECVKNDVINKNGRRFQMRFCTSALKAHQGLSDTAVTVVSTDTGTKASLIAARLKGFDPVHTKKFMEWMLESGGPR